MAEFSKTEFINGLTKNLETLESMLEVLAKVGNGFRVRLDTEGGRDFLQELSKVKVTGGNRPLFGDYGNNLESFMKETAQRGEKIIRYINDGILECPKDQVEDLKRGVKDCIDAFIAKPRPKLPPGFGRQNAEYILDLLIKILNRINEFTLSMLIRIPKQVPAVAILWGGKRWNVIPIAYSKKLKKSFESIYAKQQSVSTHCNGHNHHPDCQCGWGGPRETAII